MIAQMRIRGSSIADMKVGQSLYLGSLPAGATISQPIYDLANGEIVIQVETPDDPPPTISIGYYGVEW